MIRELGRLRDEALAKLNQIKQDEQPGWENEYAAQSEQVDHLENEIHSPFLR